MSLRAASLPLDFQHGGGLDEALLISARWALREVGVVEQKFAF